MKLLVDMVTRVGTKDVQKVVRCSQDEREYPC